MCVCGGVGDSWVKKLSNLSVQRILVLQMDKKGCINFYFFNFNSRLSSSEQAGLPW